MGTNFYLTLLNGNRVHLGKRSRGWSFLWNGNNGVWWHNLATLQAFLLTGAISDDDDEDFVWNLNDFTNMAMNWHPNIYQTPPPDGSVVRGIIVCGADDLIINGLRVSQSTDFS